MLNRNLPEVYVRAVRSLGDPPGLVGNRYGRAGGGGGRPGRTLADVRVRVDGGRECGVDLVRGVDGVFGLSGVIVCVCRGVVVF